jgi:Ricin-type beta-trefoil lectin domain-like
VGTGFAILLAVAGLAAYLVVGGTHDRKDASVLPTRVVGTQAVSIANTGPASGTTSSAETLVARRSDLLFTAGGPAGPQWTSDQMAGGTYILIYLPNGMCLATGASAPAPAVALERCNLKSNQRWLRQRPSVGANGLDYWQMRNLADGRCLEAGRTAGAGRSAVLLRPCSVSPDWRQQVAFLTTP